MLMLLSIRLQVLTQFNDDEGRRSPRYSTSSHEVLGVVDPQSRRVLSFTDAVRRGLVDLATGALLHYHLATGVYRDQHDRFVYPSDAIRQGYIKTRLVSQSDDPPAGRSPVLPGELGTMALVRHGGEDDSVSPTAELTCWPLTPQTPGTPGTPGVSPLRCHVRRTISGWLLDL